MKVFVYLLATFLLLTGVSAQTCGDGDVQFPEQCDGNPGSIFDWGTVTSCHILDPNYFVDPTPGYPDWNVAPYQHLTCNENCVFDTRLCRHLSDVTWSEWIGGTWQEVTHNDYPIQVVANCGDGEPHPHKQCDRGLANSDSDPNGCRTDCTLPRCGDGVVDTDETCDPGQTPVNCNLVSPGTSGPSPCKSDCSGYDLTYCLSACGGGVIQAGEQCDSGVGLINCQDFGFNPGGSLSCGAAGNTNGCMLLTSGCSSSPPAPTCGNGLVELGEDCDFRLSDNTSIFQSTLLTCTELNPAWTQGYLKCFPKGLPGIECKADTRKCSAADPMAPDYGQVEMKCGTQVVVTHQNGNGGDDTSVTGFNPCNVPDTVPGGIVNPPTQMCDNSFDDCVFADETTGYAPVCIEPFGWDDDAVITNAEGNRIVCTAENTWCPENFRYNTILGKCIEDQQVCDWGSDANGYANNCNTIEKIMQNPELCLSDFIAPMDPSPYQKICWPFKFSIANGFKLFFPLDVKVY